MAVKEESSHHATDELIRPPRKYYRASNGIHSGHWQLRSVVSSPKQNIVYYPSGQDIIRLNTKTREREIVTTLSFSPRCLAASKDWLAIGGELGDYTAVFVGDASTASEFVARTEADADARLPLSLDIPRNSSSRDESSSSRTSRGLRYHLFPEAKKIGTDIVNSITLWYPPSDGSKRIYRMPVAVIASNDCSVCIMSLQDLETLQKLTFPDPVNRAVISPDGELLVAVGDDPYLYVYKRKSKSAPKNRFESKRDVHYEWAMADRIQIQGQRESDKTQHRGSFAASFSQSGKYFAIGTQYGIISVFLTCALIKEDHDPLIVAFTTSRPSEQAGAVRALEFSSGPFDLLAWTEHDGRCGVADVRDLFFSRQLLMIDSHAEGVERVYISDRLGDAVIDPRLRSFRSDSSTPDYLGLDFERRRVRDLTREILDRQQAPPTADEMEVLRASTMARRQRDAARDAQEPDSNSTGWTAWDDAQRSSSATPTDGITAERRVTTTGLPSALREFVNSDRNSTNFRAFIDRQNQDRERREQQSELMGRISGRLDRLGMLVDAGTTSVYVRAREHVGSSSSLTRNSNDNSTGLERLTLAPPRLPAIGTDSPSPGWAELEARYRTRYQDDATTRSARLQDDTATGSTRLSARLRVEREDDDMRDFALRLRQPWRPFDEINRLSLDFRDEVNSLRRPPRSESVDTQGLSWSPDGRTLYVGATDGIHEFSVNVAGRKTFPSLVLR